MAETFIYALGGGFGHLTRAAALARAALPQLPSRILTNSPHADLVRHALPELDITVMNPGISLEGGRATALRYLDAAAPDCLIVDTFPRGLGGELAGFLASFRGTRIVVQRDLNPRYIAAYHLESFVAESYDLVLIPGDAAVDSLPLVPPAVKTAPWLVRSGGETLTQGAARTFLGVTEQLPCVIVCASGNREELDWYGDVTQRLFASSLCHVRCISPAPPPVCPLECWIRYWPAIDLYAAADAVVGSAGYNTIYECLACGVPLIARPWTRKYDRQQLRAQRAAEHGAVTLVHTAEQAAAAALHALTNPPAIRPSNFRNGAEEAIRLIQRASRPHAAT